MWGFLLLLAPLGRYLGSRVASALFSTASRNDTRKAPALTNEELTMCCGRIMSIFPTTPASARRLEPTALPKRRGEKAATHYEYTGPTSLRVRAPLSGHTYVFEARGAILSVEPIDAPALATIPGLQPIHR